MTGPTSCPLPRTLHWGFAGALYLSCEWELGSRRGWEGSKTLPLPGCVPAPLPVVGWWASSQLTETIDTVGHAAIIYQCPALNLALILFLPHSESLEVLLSPFYRRGTRSSERLSNIPEVKQQSWAQTRVCRRPEHTLFHGFPPPYPRKTLLSNGRKSNVLGRAE